MNQDFQIPAGAILAQVTVPQDNNPAGVGGYYARIGNSTTNNGTPTEFNDRSNYPGQSNILQGCIYDAHTLIGATTLTVDISATVGDDQGNLYCKIVTA